MEFFKRLFLLLLLLLVSVFPYRVATSIPAYQLGKARMPPGGCPLPPPLQGREEATTDIVTGPVPPPGKLTCAAAPRRLERYKDSHWDVLSLVSECFCFHYFPANVQHPAALPFERTLFRWTHPEYGLAIPLTWIQEWDRGDDGESDVYDLKIGWVEGCSADERTMIPSATECWNVLRWTWQNCNNRGRGGSFEISCITFSMTAKY